MSETPKSIQDLNDYVSKLNRNHYENSETGLVNPNEAPNANTIYHIYNDGEITYQKGGFAYKQRTEFTMSNNIFEDSPFTFPIKLNEKYSYAILTEEECKKVRNMMKAFDV